MNGSSGTWRLRQQAAQLTRLFIDAGLSGTETLESVGRLGRHLDARAELTGEADALATDLRIRSNRAFDDLTRAEREAEVLERTLAAVYDELTRATELETHVAGSSAMLLDQLQALHER